MLPADLVGELSEVAEFTARLEGLDSQSTRDDHTLNLVVRSRDTLEDLEALESGGTTLGLVGHHTTESAPEDTGRSTVVERTRATGIGGVTLVQEVEPLELVTEI